MNNKERKEIALFLLGLDDKGCADELIGRLEDKKLKEEYLRAVEDERVDLEMRQRVIDLSVDMWQDKYPRDARGHYVMSKTYSIGDFYNLAYEALAKEFKEKEDIDSLELLYVTRKDKK